MVAMTKETIFSASADNTIPSLDGMRAIANLRTHLHQKYLSHKPLPELALLAWIVYRARKEIISVLKSIKPVE